MISVRNHLLLSNGSSLIPSSFLVCLILLVASCSGSKKTTSNPRVVKPKRDIKQLADKSYGEVDTIEWTEIDRSREYNEKIEDLELDKRSRYQVALLYPFNIDGTSYDDANSHKSALGRVTQYYAGTRLALEQLNQEGINLNVKVYDSEDGDFDMKLQQCRNADVIIGPRERGQLMTTAQYGKNNEIPVVSPWLSSSKVTNENPYYIQLKPSLKSHMVKIVDHVKDNYSDSQVILLGRKNKKDLGMMKYIQQVAAAKNRMGSSKPFKEFFIEEDSLINGEQAYDDVFYKDRRTVFILPNWSFSDDEQFVYNAVRKLSGEKGLNDVALYGMPILLESERVKFEHYANLNMCIARTSYLDRQSEIVKEFRVQYYDRYQDFPSEEAYKGFDMMMYVGRNIYNYGKKFQYFLDTYESSLYQTEYDVQKVFSKASGDRFDRIEYFQNDHLYILEFKDNHFIHQKSNKSDQ